MLAWLLKVINTFLALSQVQEGVQLSVSLNSTGFLRVWPSLDLRMLIFISPFFARMLVLHNHQSIFLMKSSGTYYVWYIITSCNTKHFYALAYTTLCIWQRTSTIWMCCFLLPYHVLGHIHPHTISILRLIGPLIRGLDENLLQWAT